jgi:hypothetical protein
MSRVLAEEIIPNKRLHRTAIPLGETIIVRGFVDDDFKSYFRPEFYAFEIIREDGSVIKLN